jgi:hypothetical protein
MAALFVTGLLLCGRAEQAGHRGLADILGLSEHASELQPGGNRKQKVGNAVPTDGMLFVVLLVATRRLSNTPRPLG